MEYSGGFISGGICVGNFSTVPLDSAQRVERTPLAVGGSDLTCQRQGALDRRQPFSMTTQRVEGETAGA